MYFSIDIYALRAIERINREISGGLKYSVIFGNNKSMRHLETALTITINPFQKKIIELLIFEF